MENLIIDELTKKKLSTWTRLLIYIIDAVCIIGLILLLFYTLGEISIKKIASDSINKINQVYASECAKNDYSYNEEFAGIYQLDQDSFIEQYMNNNPDVSYEDAMLAYNDEYYAIDTAIQSDDTYLSAYANFSTIYYITLLSCFLISSFIFLLLIPLCNNKRKTIGNLITKTSCVYDKTNILVSNKIILLRFFTIFSIELCLAYIAFGIISLLFVGIISIITISFSKKKKAIHDFLCFTHIEKDEFTYTA